MEQSIIRNCQKEDIPALFAMFKTVYRFNPRLQERDYFDWQFKNTPFDNEGEYTFLVSEQSGKIKGFLGYVPVQFRYGNQILMGCFTQNWYSTGADSGGLQLLTHLMGQYDYRFHIGASEQAIQIHQMSRVPVLERFPRWVGVIAPQAVIDLFQITLPSDRQTITAAAQRLTAHKSSVGVEKCARFLPDEEFLLDHWPTVEGYCRRTGCYLNWRYLDIPKHNYQAICNERGQCAVYRIEPVTGYSESALRILEWTFDRAAGPTAMAALLEEAQLHNTILMDFFCTAEEIGAAFGDMGFLAQDSLAQTIPYLFRPIHPHPGIALAVDLPPHRKKRSFNFDRWYFSKGDSDIDRIKL